MTRGSSLHTVRAQPGRRGEVPASVSRWHRGSLETGLQDSYEEVRSCQGLEGPPARTGGCTFFCAPKPIALKDTQAPQSDDKHPSPPNRAFVGL